jgi:hypothetical protein
MIACSYLIGSCHFWLFTLLSGPSDHVVTRLMALIVVSLHVYGNFGFLPFTNSTVGASACTQTQQELHGIEVSRDSDSHDYQATPTNPERPYNDPRTRR